MAIQCYTSMSSIERTCKDCYRSIADAFRAPVFSVTLGRSQDLASIRRVDVVNLEESDRGYFEHTLLPFEWARPRTPRGVTVVMPRFISPAPERDAEFARYIVLHERLMAGRWEGSPTPPPSQRLLYLEGQERTAWLVDPESTPHLGVKRALEFLSFA